MVDGSFLGRVHRYTARVPPAIRAGKGWRERRELAPRCSATQLGALRRLAGQTPSCLNYPYHTHHTDHPTRDREEKRTEEKETEDRGERRQKTEERGDRREERGEKTREDERDKEKRPEDQEIKRR